ncbi:hypothetical protein [Microcoleus sp. herbarium12]|uniref:hypothetical protein n=1 Tax=Microcoleus sp. herbarium12 TaxID=3055437 RepID=UPI002FD2E01E
MNLFTLYLSRADRFFLVAIGYRYLYSEIFINLYFALVPSGGYAIELQPHLASPLAGRHEVQIDRPARCSGITGDRGGCNFKLK